MLLNVSLMLCMAFSSSAQKKLLYNDDHFHGVMSQGDGPALPDLIKMMDEGGVGRMGLMSAAFTIAHDPLVDGSYVPIYYNQTEGDVIYYNAIQDVMVATKYLALNEEQKKRFDPLMCAFNLKDALAAKYIKKMIMAYPGVWSGFGEIHFKKEDTMDKMAGGAMSLNSPAIDSIMNVWEELGAMAVVHCDNDAPGNIGLMDDPFAKIIFGPEGARPQYRAKFKEILGRHPKANLLWSHFCGMSRGVGVYEDHWDFIDDMLSDPAFSHVYVDISWGPVVAHWVMDTPEHRKKTIELVKKYPERFVYGSDQGQTTNWEGVYKNYTAWNDLWEALTPEQLKMVTQDNYVKLITKSEKNIRAWEAKQKPIR